MFTAEEKYAEAVRELKMRTRVYPGMIASGSISAETAAHRIQLMDEIMKDYEKLALVERLL